MAKKNPLGCWNKDLCVPRGHCLCELRSAAYDEIRDLHKAMERYAFQHRQELLKQVHDHETQLRGWIANNLGAYKTEEEYKRPWRRKKVVTRSVVVQQDLGYFKKLGAQAYHAPWVEEAVNEALELAKRNDPHAFYAAKATFTSGWTLADQFALAAR